MITAIKIEPADKVQVTEFRRIMDAEEGWVGARYYTLEDDKTWDVLPGFVIWHPETKRALVTFCGVVRTQAHGLRDAVERALYFQGKEIIKSEVA